VNICTRRKIINDMDIDVLSIYTVIIYFNN